MPRYVAFLRAINVGGRNVKMQTLKKIFETDGFKNVETFIASGNVLFDSTAKPASLERKIEALLQRELGYRVDTFVRSIPELEIVVTDSPFGEEDGGTIHIAFTAQLFDKAEKERVATMESEVDRFHISGRDLYWYTSGRSSDSPFSGAALEKSIKRPATFRNLKTVRKLAGAK